MFLHSKTKSVVFLILCCVSAAIIAVCCSFANQSTQVVPVESQPKKQVEQSKPLSNCCELIRDGKFRQAGELIDANSLGGQKPFSQLKAIVNDYQQISDKRDEARKAAYQKQLAELDKLQKQAEANSVKEVNEVNDVNNITSALAVINTANELADANEKEKLLDLPFVKSVFARSLEKAAKFEAEGKWLDSYITCYSWLQSIYKDNKSYKEHSEELLDKANILASFQDSPCETSKERYSGIEKGMFIWAESTLSYAYVATPDYYQMATKAITRCKLLGEVLIASYSQLKKSGSKDSLGKFLESPPDEAKFRGWSAGLTDIQDEINKTPVGMSKDKFTDVFEKVLTHNKETIEIPEHILIAQFAEAAFDALDPYTVMIWPKQVEDFEKMLTNEFTGVGIEISKEKGFLTASSLLPDTPAYRSGIDAGDIIEAVDGTSTKDMPIGCAVKKITGPAGTKVTLTVRTPGAEKARDITITRDKIVVPSVRGWQRTEGGKWLYMVDDAEKIGYVRLTAFSEKSASELEAVLDSLEIDGLKGLILDLRFNPGGLLTSAVDISDKFISDGIIVSTVPRFGVTSTMFAHKKDTHPDYPLVILVNNFSASASEIVAGALADKQHKRAILVGERTHGKGSVQGIIGHSGDNVKLKYTMAHYHLPSGQRVESRDEMEKKGRQDWGVGANVEVKLRSDELKKMIDIQRDNDVLVKAGHINNGKSLKKHTIEETLNADPQLAIGLLVVKSQLICEKN